MRCTGDKALRQSQFVCVERATVKAEMAQSSISSYYRTTRKRAAEGEAVAAKRRKAVSQEQNPLSSFIQPAEPTVAETKARRSTRTSGAKAKSQTTSVSRRPKRKATRKQGPTIQSLFTAVQEETNVLTHATGKRPEPAQAVPAPCPPKATLAPSAPSPLKTVPAPSPLKTVPAPSPLKTVPAPSPLKTVPAPSPLKTVPAPSSLMTISTPSPLRTAVSSRSSLMLQMAKDKQENRAREAKMSVRRRLLADPCPVEGRSQGVPVAELRALRGMSARELAMPTAVEKAKVGGAGSASPQIKSFSAFHVASPSKSSSPSQPAYQRHQSLAVGEVCELPLPQKYLLLAEKFRCVDMIANMLQKRGETCTLRKLKEAVEEMLKRSFVEQNLGQMKHVYPGAFLFRQERHIPGNYDRNVFEKYQLTVECNVEETGQAALQPCVSSSGGHRFLSSQALLQRRKTFRMGLEQATRQHHKEYLRQKSIEVADGELKRWHPDFPLHDVADVPVSPLPSAPKTEDIASAREVLARLQHKEVSEMQETTMVLPEVAMPARQNEALIGVSANLIEKIKEREALRMKRHLIRNNETQRRLDILGRLGSFCRILNSHFVTSKKVALPLDDVVQKLSESLSSELAKDSLEAHLEVLLEVLGQWVQRVEIRGKVYIKRVDKMMDMKTLADIIRQKEKELEHA